MLGSTSKGLQLFLTLASAGIGNAATGNEYAPYFA